MPSVLYPWLAVAGAAAAAIPVVVHLLNRRRFRVVQWAAMDFLREALGRSRRLLELRDLLLLALRALCLVVFGAALARPYWSRQASTVLEANQPVHAVVLVDNSLSMSFEKFKGILLDEAKAKARALIEDLPGGSAISVVPVCGSAGGVNFEAFTRPEDALEALAAIKPADGAARAGAVIDLALEACRRKTGLGAHRIFLVTDQQVGNWSGQAEREHLNQLPAAMQVVQVMADELENAWVADVRLRDGVADAQSPAVFLAEIRYQGKAPRSNVPVALEIDGLPVASQTVTLQPGQQREIRFPEYHFPASAEGGKASYATAKVSIPHDRLPGDDQRYLVVPVTTSLPVVFVDALGAEESPAESRYGDTYWLRRLVAPRLRRASQEQPLIQVRQLKIEQVTRQALADARLAVVAGVRAPTPAAVEALGQFVEQGGNLLVAAGGDFDPAAWTEAAWKGGAGILPAPLEPTCRGRLRDDPADAALPWTMSFESLAHEYFQPEGESEEAQRGRFGPPMFFFKTAVPRCDADAQAKAAAAATEHFGRQRRELAEIDGRLAGADSGRNGSAKPGEASGLEDRAELLRRRETVEPAWLAWRAGGAAGEDAQRPIDQLARRAEPVVLARYSNDVPMLVRRQWGRGQVLFLSTSLSPQWTTWPDLGQSWWLMDRIVRGLLMETLPPRNLSSEGAFVLPVAIGERSARYTLADPEGQQQTLAVDALGGDHFGISLGNWTRRGVYRVTAARPSETAGGQETKLWEIPLAVNGPAEESALVVEAGRPAGAGESFIEATAQASTTASAASEDVNLWKWLVGLVLVLLVAELFLAARTTPRREAAA